jgi:hypothetical protein
MRPAVSDARVADARVADARVADAHLSDAHPAVVSSAPFVSDPQASVAAVVELAAAPYASPANRSDALRPPHASMLVRPSLAAVAAPLAALIAPPPVPASVAAGSPAPVLPQVFPDPAPNDSRPVGDRGERPLRHVDAAPVPLELPPLHAPHEGTAGGGAAGAGSGASGGLIGVALGAMFLALVGSGIGRRLRLACQPFLSSYLLSLPARPG